VVEKISLPAYSVILLGIILLIMILRRDHRFLSRRLFLLIILSTLVMLFSEMAVTLADGRPGPGALGINKVFNFILHAFATLPIALWLGYFELYVFNDWDRVKRSLQNKIPVILSLILVLYSEFSGFVYVIDEHNHRFMNSGVYIIYFLNLFMLVAAVVLFFRHRELIDKRTRFAFLSFPVLPCAAAALQMVFPDFFLVWNGVALSLVFFFYFIEVQDFNRDFLTGLPSRRQGDDWIERKMSKAATDGRFGLIMIDMDGFKEINDSFGHGEGDFALNLFGTILQKSLKQKDRAVRFAGDEFLIIVDSSEPEVFEAVISRLHKNLDQFNEKKVKPYNLSFSAGYAVHTPGKYQNSRQLINEADKKMYETKRMKLQLQGRAEEASGSPSPNRENFRARQDGGQ